jgi:hypothetical protein
MANAIIPGIKTGKQVTVSDRLENGSPAGFFLVTPGKDTLYNKLIGTPVPESDNCRTNQSPNQGKSGSLLFPYKSDHVSPYSFTGVAPQTANTSSQPPTALNPRTTMTSDPISKIGFEGLMYINTDFIPPNTVYKAVISTNPIADIRRSQYPEFFYAEYLLENKSPA